MIKIPLFAWIISFVAGVILPLFVFPFRRMLRQPQLASRIVPAPANEYRNIEERAYKIAENNLREGLEKRCLPDGTERLILCAGVRHFREPWARDTGFASFGLIELDELQATKEALEVFLLTQSDAGQFPVKIHSTQVLERYLHSIFKREQPTDRPISPRYITAHNTISLDGNSLLIIAILNYARRSGDYDFVRMNWDKLKGALSWLGTHVKETDGLLHQGAFTDWADSIARQGKVLYTNVIYWKAQLDMAEAAQSCGHPEDRRTIGQKARHIRDAINEHFWRSDLGYYVNTQSFDNLCSSGNLLAIAWGLASPEQAHAILDAMRYLGMGTPVPTKAVQRAYPRKFIAIENRLGGIADYHTYFAWLWLGAWHVIALARMKRLEEAHELLYNMSRVIVRDGAVHEVYQPNGHYASNIWYTSESPLTWSAGMFIYAYHVYQRHVSS
jgi:GH15 family glucan-1,4-alpha-glucosidase